MPVACTEGPILILANPFQWSGTQKRIGRVYRTMWHYIYVDVAVRRAAILGSAAVNVPNVDHACLIATTDYQNLQVRFF